MYRSSSLWFANPQKCQTMQKICKTFDDLGWNPAKYKQYDLVRDPKLPEKPVVLVVGQERDKKEEDQQDWGIRWIP